jgi:ribonuclease-3 family protein
VLYYFIQKQTGKNMENELLLTKILSVEEANLLNPQVLAFVGDSVYTLILRTYFAKKSPAKSGKLHIFCNEYMSAPAQSLHLDLLLPLFSEQEHNIMRRGRNTHVHSMAKNANVEEYKKATGFEAVFGFLYLTGQYERIYRFVDLILNKGTV